MYIVKYDYIGEHACDECYGIENHANTWEEAIDIKAYLKENENILNIQIIGLDY